MEGKIEESDALVRRNTLIFSGEGVPRQSGQEKCSVKVCHLLREKLTLSMVHSDISAAHKLGKKSHSLKPDNRN